MNCSRMSARHEAYHKQVQKAMRRFLPVRGLPLISEDDRVRWTDRMLVQAVILLTWSTSTTLCDAFAEARDTVVAMYPTRKRPGATLGGFLRTWAKRSAGLLARVTAHLRQKMLALAGDAWCSHGYVVLGVDGSRINSPRSVANEAAFGCAGKPGTAPQQLLVTVFHVAMGLPWAWRRGAGDASERNLFRDMRNELPDRTLLLMDAGFTGFELLRELAAAGHAFIVRAGANVRLLRKLGYATREHAGIVYLWPKGKRKETPLALRLVTLQSHGKPMALLTNILDESELSDREVAELYRRRWTIEVMYRSLKETLSKRTLLGETPQVARCELDWAMVGLWMLGMLTLEQTGVRRGWSPAGALRVIREALRTRHPVGSARLRKQLTQARPDPYERQGPKTTRKWPRKKTDSPPGVPEIRTADNDEIKAAKALMTKKAAA